MTAADPHLLTPGHAPTPFSAAEIREGCPPGRTMRLLVEADGADPVVRVVRFVTADEDGADQEAQRFTLEGDPLDDPSRSHSTWLEFQSHASYPEEQTAIDPVTLAGPLGDLACLRYTVTDGATQRIFWFARSLPGMPVRVETREAGRVTSTVTMTENAFEA